MKKKTAILLVELLSLQQPFPAVEKTKRRQRQPMKVWSLKTRKEKPKTAMMQRKKKKKKQKKLRQQIRK